MVVPEVPTIAESGVPGFDYGVWYGIFGPAKTPPVLVAKLTEQLKKTLSSPEVPSSCLPRVPSLPT